MSASTLKFIIVSSPQTKFSDAQVLLREITGKRFSREEAETVWTNVINHKWNVSEQLGRDVGLRVAAIDFVENFYQPDIKDKTSLLNKTGLLSLLRKAFQIYFNAKANSINY